MHMFMLFLLWIDTFSSTTLLHVTHRLMQHVSRQWHPNRVYNGIIKKEACRISIHKVQIFTYEHVQQVFRVSRAILNKEYYIPLIPYRSGTVRFNVLPVYLCNAHNENVYIHLLHNCVCPWLIKEIYISSLCSFENILTFPLLTTLLLQYCVWELAGWAKLLKWQNVTKLFRINKAHIHTQYRNI